METLNFLLQGFDVATRPTNLLVALFGAFVGTVVGLLPGLGPINGVALLLPLAFALGLPPETALILLAAVYLGCEYGGRISAMAPLAVRAGRLDRAALHRAAARHCLETTGSSPSTCNLPSSKHCQCH